MVSIQVDFSNLISVQLSFRDLSWALLKRRPAFGRFVDDLVEVFLIFVAQELRLKGVHRTEVEFVLKSAETPGLPLVLRMWRQCLACLVCTEGAFLIELSEVSVQLYIHTRPVNE
jgi:hypothetical protein